ncbi:hypothetical protein [Patulibacter defluvii]|uniref:hypothetical protein n=1 Tax=Patulibacter defluvii TaxID=3095358 RepID=UPI002A74F6E9|nr:hypothetical protein [Patulibacter sp. DM4]
MTSVDPPPARGPWPRWLLAATCTAALAGVAAPPLLAPAAQGRAAIGSEGKKTLGRTIGYLQAAQNRDGGFPRGRRGASHPGTSVWVALAVAAAGINPQDQTVRGGTRLWAYLERRARDFDGSDDLARLALAAVAAGVSPQAVGGRDLIAALRERQAADGSLPSRAGGGASIEATAWAVLAFARSDAREAATRGAAWLAGQEGADDGWGLTPGASSEAPVTGLVLQALGVSDRAAHRTRIDAGVSFLRGLQSRNGAIRFSAVGASDPVSTAFAIQGALAAGQDPLTWSDGGRSPLDYLAGRQRDDGSVGSPLIWRTAQATPGLAAVTFPLQARSRRGPTNGSGGDVDGGSDRGEDAEVFSRPNGGGGSTAGGSEDGDRDAGGGPRGTGGEPRSGLTASNGNADGGQSSRETRDQQTRGSDDRGAAAPPTPAGGDGGSGGGDVSGTVVGATEAASGDPTAAGGAAPSLRGRDEGGPDAPLILGGAMVLLLVVGGALERRPARQELVA